ncbi:MAG: hypothetical protein WDN69_29325 [Aliidongia sp.]
MAENTPLAFAAHQQVADNRQIAERAVQRIGRDQRAVEVETAGIEVEVPVDIDADGAAIGARMAEPELAVIERHVALQRRERDAVAVQQILDRGEGGER